MALDARVRNLVAMGKRVILTGDLNIIREEIDTANVEEQLRKQGITLDEYFSSPARRILNQLLVGGRVIGQRDEGREHPVLWDVCRLFHPGRKGMFTCWEQKINARPGNFGSRIDYLLCSEDLKNWFYESNIQEGLMGSDHCPVYAVLKDKVKIDSKEIHIKDIVSSGMFKNGVRLREWSPRDLLLMSAKLIPEFDRRRSIRDMFTNKASVQTSATESNTRKTKESKTGEKTIARDMIYSEAGRKEFGLVVPSPKGHAFTPSESPGSLALSSKRLVEEGLSSVKPVKRSKTAMAPKLATTGKGQSEKGQSSLIGFFKPKISQTRFQGTDVSSPAPDTQLRSVYITDLNPPTTSQYISETSILCLEEGGEYGASSKPDGTADRDSFIDPIAAKESWSKLLGKRNLPRCEHNEPCISLVTRKPGVNCGRSFYICARPLGPSGQKEKNSNWRCGTFIWSSDWAHDGT
jgi:AP endonuclease-2